MKRPLLACFVVSALIAPAMADEMPAAPGPPVPPGPLHVGPEIHLTPSWLVWNWTGLYIGVNAGWIDSSGMGHTITNDGTDTGTGGLGTALRLAKIPGSIGLPHSGFIGGAQIGYNWQIGSNWAAGIETDFDGDGGGSSSTGSAFAGSKTIVPLSTTYNRELDTFGTVRARFGYLMAPDQLWYITGGLAYGQTKIGSAFSCAGCKPPAGTEGSTVNETSTTSTGWTAGAGIEWKFAPAWSVKAEYLYVDLGNPSNTIGYTYGKNVSTLTSTANESDNVVRIGINYKLF
jgi:outer membrane immunogenic protein